MAFPEPEPGLVISYSYLWRYELDAGMEEGRKTRPCVIVLSAEKQENHIQVTVAPVTHSQPENPEFAIEIPIKVKQHLGLDEQKSWVIINEVNQFAWPGYDLRPVPGTKCYDYGFIPPKLFENIKEKMFSIILNKLVKVTGRD